MKSTQKSKKQTTNTLNSSIFKAAVLSAKQRKKGFSMPLCFFGILTLLSLCLAFVLPDTLILTVPFVIAPSFFSYFASYTMDLKGESDIGAFFVMYKVYFNRVFSGCFRLLIAFLKAVLVFLVSSIVVYCVFELSVFNNIPEYAALKDSIAKVGSLSETNNMMFSLMESNALFGNLMNLTSYLSLVFASMFFVHHVAYSCPKLCFNILRNQPMPMREFTVIDKMVKKQDGHKFWKTYFSATWFLDLILLLGFAIAAVLQYFVLTNVDVFETIVMGFGLSFILLMPLLNYLCEVFVIMFVRFTPQYEQTFTNFTIDFLTKYKDKLGINEEQANELKNLVKPNEDKKENKEKDDKK